MVLIAGNFLTPPIMARFGRRAAHMAVTIPMIVGWIIMFLASNVETLIAARVLHGLSFGMLLPLRSPLIGEYTSPKYRGAFLTMVSLSQAFGIFFVHLIGSIVSWRKTCLINVVFSAISLIMIFYCPESPGWLVAKGKYDECRRIFRWLRGDDEEEELKEMIQARKIYVRQEQIRKSAQKNRFQNGKEILTKSEFYKPIILMLHLYCVAQFSGGTLLANYSIKVIGHLLGPDANAHLWMVILDTQRLISNTAAIFIINKMNRRTMVFTTGAISVASHLGIVIYMYTKEHGMFSTQMIWLPVLLLNLQVFSIAVGMIPLPNVIAGEVFPLEYRNIGNSISLFGVSGFFFLIAKSFPALVDNLGMTGTYTLYGSVLMYNLIVIWFMLPETKDRTLQQIEDTFRGKPLTLEEITSRESLYQDPIVAYKRKLSERDRRCSSPMLA